MEADCLAAVGISELIVLAHELAQSYVRCRVLDSRPMSEDFLPTLEAPNVMTKQSSRLTLSFFSFIREQNNPLCTFVFILCTCVPVEA